MSKHTCPECDSDDTNPFSDTDDTMHTCDECGHVFMPDDDDDDEELPTGSSPDGSGNDSSDDDDDDFDDDEIESPTMMSRFGKAATVLLLQNAERKDGTTYVLAGTTVAVLAVEGV